MKRFKNITIIFLLAVGLLSSIAPPVCLASRSSGAKSSSVLLQEGLYAEQVDGDLDAAIRIYGQIIKDSSAQRSHIAQAMYRQGMCYLKKQDEQQAKEVFGKLVADFSDQTKIVDKVKPMLDELGDADPAALMPPETLIYIETGSPGRQIETILNMLKGTPFENPLAALGGGREPRPNLGGKSPGDMVAALLNPAMIAEFKKIRGMAIGVTGIAQNNPPCIAVLYPGKSDALRGIILAALGMVGTQGEPIEGMQTVTIAGTAGVAHDDNIVIIAQPAEQLTWSVKQYKGLASKPTLASSNKSFAKLSKKARQENALTIWANVDEVFAGLSKIFPEGSIPNHIRIADGFADFKNIDDLIVFCNIQENGIAFEKNIAFKDGHRCLAYNLIRTPNLSRAGFEAVPSEAVALVSVALGEAESAQAIAAGKRIESLTGLDIGREIFANIEQITLFALPPESVSNQSNTGIPPIATNLGLAVTSHNPQQTREILTQLLTVANLVAGQFTSEQLEQGTGKYQIGLVNNQKLYCYMNQMNKTTVLSLNPGVVETSISAIKRRRSVFTAGPLQEAVNKLSPTTSKLVLVNVGGGIRVADAFLNATYNNPQNPAHKTLAQLAKACDKTGIQLHTDERINNFNSRFSIDQLPPLDSVFPLLMQLSQTDPTAKVKATKPEPRDGATIGLTSVSKLEWKPGASAKSHKVYFGTKIEELSLLAEVQRSSYTELPELEEGSKYYWRVDEVWADGNVITGDVWSFTTGKLVGWWKFDEISGETAEDSAGNNDGRLVGDPQWQPTGGKVGGALEFDGDGDYVDCGADPAFDITGKITVAAWVNIRSIPTQWVAVVAKGENAWRLSNVRSGTNFHFGIAIWSSPNPSVDGSTQVGTNEWHHVCGTYNGSAINIYLDGVLDGTISNTTGIGTSTTSLLIGENPEATGRYWDGLIDDVRIYNYALSEKEIEMLCRVKAIKPHPSDGATIGLTEMPELSWVPAIGATSHKVYGGVEPDELKLLGETTEFHSFKLPDMHKNMKYYWRVDGILADGSIAKGDVWKLTVGKLVGWWKFDGNANDSSGNGNNGTEIGDPTYVAGKIGQAISFDGEGDRIEVPATIAGNPELFPATAISASAWVRTTASANSLYSLVRHEFHFTPLQTYAGSAQSAAFTNQDGSRALHVTTSDWSKINDGKWHHCAVTYNNGIHEVWIDGTKEESNNFGSYPLWTGDNQPWVFGGREHVEGRDDEDYPGELDDVRIYNYALSEGEITALYNESR